MPLSSVRLQVMMVTWPVLNLRFYAGMVGEESVEVLTEQIYLQYQQMATPTLVQASWAAQVTKMF